MKKHSLLRGISLLTVLALLAGVLPAGLLPMGRSARAESTADYTSPVLLTFTDSGISAEGAAGGYEIDGTTLKIDASGIYGITGSCADGSIVVKKAVTGVVLILSDLTLACSSSAPVVCKASSETTLFATGSVTLTNSETDETAEDYEGAAIKVKSGASLTIEGDGTLNVYNALKNGIKGAACAAVTVQMNSSGSALNVEAANNGIASDGAVTIRSGNVSVTAGNEGIKSEPEETDTDSAGTVTVTGGSVTVNAGSDGIQAAGGIVISGGTFDVTADSDCIHSRADMTISGGTFNLVTLGVNSTSSKGVKASVSDDTTEDSTITLTVTGGAFTINTVDDAVHCDGYIVITGGVFDIVTGDDGVHADTSLTLGTAGGCDRDPYITVQSGYEGLEAGNVYIYGGKYYVRATDDGINAAGGSSSGSDPGAGGGNHFNPGGGPGPAGSGSSSGDYSLNIYGGHVYVNADGDGLDSNGSLNLTGGDVEVWSQSSGDNEPLDCDGTLTVNGATVLAAGCVGMGQARPSGGQTYKNVTSSVSAGKVISVLNGSTLLYNAAAPKSVSYIFFSSPDLTSSCTVSSASGTVDCSAGGSFSHTWSGTVCTVCGAVETQSAPADSAVTVYKTAEIVPDSGEYKASFVIENGTVDLYYTDSAEEPDETGAAEAWPRTDGEIDWSGEGGIRFRVVPDDGYAVSLVEVEGAYGELLGWDDTGVRDEYRITDVAGDLTVTAVLLADTEPGFTASFVSADEAGDGHFTVTAYYTHNYTETDASTCVSGVTSAAARSDLTGGIDISGGGQVNFRIVPDEGWTVYAVAVTGDYKNLKDVSEAAGREDTWRVTRVAGDITVAVTLISSETPVISLWEGQTVTLPFSGAAEDAGVASVSGTSLTAVSAGKTLLTGTDTACLVKVYADAAVLTLPSGLTAVCEEAFAGDSGVRFVVLGDAVESVEANAFLDSGLVQLQVSSADTVLDAAALTGTSPTVVCDEGSAAESFALTYGYTYVYAD